jgi:Ca2+-binding EF-hand superfamily protein
MRFTAILMGLVFIVATGCGRAPVAAPASPAVSKAKATAPPKTTKDAATAKPAAATPEATSPSPEASKSSEVAAAHQTEKEQVACERIVIFTLDGPLIADVAVTLDGRPLTAVFDEQVKKVLDAADTDKDGRATWKELASTDYLADGQAERAPVGARQLKTLLERYDENRDGLVQEREAMAWLGRNTETSAHAFEVRSARSYLPNPRAGSRVWQLVDADGSGGLSPEELAAAPDKFWAFDADDDRVITMPELASLRELLEAQNPAMSYAAQDDDLHAAVYLESEKELDVLESVLGSLYSPRQTIGVTSLGKQTKLFDTLDVNSDGWLEKQELGKFLAVEPYLKLSIAFTTPAEPQEPAATMKVDDHSEKIRLIAQATDHVVLSLGNTRIIVSARDVMPGPASSQSADRSQIRVMVHDEYDALFGELDANADGRLGEREIDSCRMRLLAKDANGDQLVGADEVSYSMIVAFLRGERANEQSFYIPGTVAMPLTDKPASTWFVRADFNRDGDISRREFLGSLEQFSQLDADGDGYIRPQEAAAFK